MNTREQFGKYLLLKKLGEDSLGEAFRAGRVGGQGMEEVVLLRVFNGPGLDGATLWQHLEGRGSVHKALTSPNIASGVDIGAVRNIPYVAYDYISGKNLANLLDQAEKRHNPIPSDHALLIAERIALGLAVGYETRFEGGRLLHGCVVPNLVMISNEGETRLLGFEAAAGLREVLKNSADASLTRYLSPEARAGHPPHKADDVYSLGVILLELITGKPVPAAGDYAPLIARAEMQPEGSPLPDELRGLLQQSLAPRDQRIADVINWHKSLSKMMFDGQYSPTTFNLAFYMHNLFREEIERESKEIEVERTMEIPVAVAPTAPAAAAPAAPTPAPGGDLREATGVREDTGVIRDKYGIEADESKKKNTQKLVLAAVAAVVMLVAGGFAYLQFGRSAPDDATTDTEATTQPGPVEPAPAPVEPVLTPEELEAQRQADLETAAEEQRKLEEQIQALVEARSKELEARISGQYDQQIEALRSDLETAQKRAEEAEAEPVPAVKPQPATPDKPKPTQVAQATPTTTPPATTQNPAQTTSDPPIETEPVTPAPAITPVTQTPKPKPPDPKPAQPGVRLGELVTLGPGVTAPKLIGMRPPTYPSIARRLRKEDIVHVRVLVDENGKVADAQLKGKEVGFGMDQEALGVARSARFQPATKNGVRVSIWWELPIQFKL